MKIFTLLTLLLVALLANGCSVFHYRAKPAKTTASARETTPTIVTPDNSLTARVVSYNASGRFAVLSFPVGQIPKLEQGLFLYREGMKVGEVKITGPQRENNIVADLVTGEAQVGDEVRDR
ncbi:MAG: hypothetical protein ABSH11_03605 [Verrucomicrobiota bacterium]|jgi:hypothetical protein